MRAVIRTREDGQRFLDRLAQKLDGKPYTVTVEPFKRPRTNPQNAKFHAMVRALAQHTGYTEAMTKEIVKAKFCPITEQKIGDDVVNVPKGSSDLKTDEMADVIERLYELGAEIGCEFQN